MGRELKSKQMKTIDLNIKNMVCPSCITVATTILSELGTKVLKIRLGFASILAPTDLSKEEIESQLKRHGFEILEDKEDVLIEQIILGVKQYIRKQECLASQPTLSCFLSKEIGKNYNFLSRLFSKRKGITIEGYYIKNRVDRVKELMKYDELSLSEISFKLNYSSVHYLSNQFRRVTGYSVSDYKALTTNDYLNCKDGPIQV